MHLAVRVPRVPVKIVLRGAQQGTCYVAMCSGWRKITTTAPACVSTGSSTRHSAATAAAPHTTAFACLDALMCSVAARWENSLGPERGRDLLRSLCRFRWDACASVPSVRRNDENVRCIYIRESIDFVPGCINVPACAPSSVIAQCGTTPVAMRQGWQHPRAQHALF